MKKTEKIKKIISTVIVAIMVLSFNTSVTAQSKIANCKRMLRAVNR